MWREASGTRARMRSAALSASFAATQHPHRAPLSQRLCAGYNPAIRPRDGDAAPLERPLGRPCQSPWYLMPLIEGGTMVGSSRALPGRLAQRATPMMCDSRC